jgi:endonuclease G
MGDDSDPGTATGRPVPTGDPALGAEIARLLERRKSMVPPAERGQRPERARADACFAFRRALVEDPARDPNGYERILGQSDLLSINFLDRGRRSADAVCRIKLPMDGGVAYGTGFLVGPRLLLTNNHVLADPREAAQASAEFGYDHDLDGVLRDPVPFNLDPDQLFFTDAELDVTLVAVVPFADSGVPLDRYGWLPLIPLSGKSVDGEWVSIIQHPNAEPKQIAIHSSQIVLLDPERVDVDLTRFIHYSTDTEPGSSGSPVFNDQWQVVAIHHKAVPAPGEPLDAAKKWLANEGVRISAIFNRLGSLRFEDDNANRALELMGRGLGFPPLAVPASASPPPSAEQYAPLPASHWQAAGLGYDPDFLPGVSIPLDPIYAAALAAGDVAPLLDGTGHELKYRHFSSLLHAKRRFPLMTAVNIAGDRLINLGARNDSWRRDRRVDPEYQPDDDFYVRTRAAEKVYFSRGHLVRLLDPGWGASADEARAAVQDTFHFTNCAPQVQAYNDQDWGDLEDYVLDKAQTSEKRLSVFTGPIYRDNDPLYGKARPGGPWRIPLSFWKIAVLQKTETRVAAAAFIVGQTEYVRALYEAKVFTGLKPYTIDEMRSRKIQTTIATVERETGLDFSAIRAFDAQGSLEATRKTRWFNRLDDVVI